MGNIGNCHHQPPATIIHWFGEDSIVEITGIGAVGVTSGVTQIAATFAGGAFNPRDSARTGSGKTCRMPNSARASALNALLINRSEIADGACCLAKIATGTPIQPD